MSFTWKSTAGQLNQAVHQSKMEKKNEIKSHKVFKLTTFPKQTIFLKLFHVFYISDEAYPTHSLSIHCYCQYFPLCFTGFYGGKALNKET